MSDILIVDDDPAITDFMADVLEEEGYRTRIAHNNADAYAAIQVTPPALILLDLSIPGNSLTVLEHVRQFSTNHTRVIVMSAVTHPPDVVAMGATDYLAKPFNIDDLLQKIKRHMSSTT